MVEINEDLYSVASESSFPVVLAKGKEDILSRPSIKYLLYYPLILAASAVLLWVEPTDKMTAVCSAVGTVVGSVVLWELLFTASVIRLTRICATGLLLGYGTGTLYSWITDPRGGYSLAVAIGFTVPMLANGVAAALMSTAVLLAGGELLERPLATRVKTLVVDKEIKRLILLGLGITWAAFATGHFARGGAKLAGNGHAGVLAEFLDFMLYPTLILTTVAFLVERSPRQKMLLGFATGLMWLLSATQGRGALIYATLATVMMARFFGYQWGNITIKKAVLIIFAVIFLVVGVLQYQLIRYASQTINHPTLKEEVEAEAHWIEEGVAWKMATTSTANNLHTRGLLAGFLSSVLYETTINSPAHGRDIVTQLEEVIPSKIYPNKPVIQEEGIASQAFRMFYTDQPNSLLTAGAVDFGVWGVMAYPIIIMIIISLLVHILKEYGSYGVFIFCLLQMIFRAFGPEVEVTGYAGDIRNAFIFALLLYAVSKMPSFSLRRHDSIGVHVAQ